MAARRTHLLDVFTDTPLAGNPLAVMLDAEGLDTDAMQRIAGEFNLSETVFVLPARDPLNFARLRIFTPRVELPFAGHPTLGAAVLLAELRAPELMRGGEVGLIFEQEIGLVSCTVRHRPNEAAHARFEAPRLARPCGSPLNPSALAEALGLERADIAGTGWLAGHAPSRYEAGVPFTFVPLASLDALGRARLRDGEHEAFYLYAATDEARVVRARMLARGLGVSEDPATGSAAAAFAGVLVAQAARARSPLADGDHDCHIRQGVEMGRPSRIGLAFNVADGRLAATTVGGHAVLVGEGVLHL